MLQMWCYKFIRRHQLKNSQTYARFRRFDDFLLFFFMPVSALVKPPPYWHEMITKSAPISCIVDDVSLPDIISSVLLADDAMRWGWQRNLVFSAKERFNWTCASFDWVFLISLRNQSKSYWKQKHKIIWKVTQSNAYLITCLNQALFLVCQCQVMHLHRKLYEQNVCFLIKRKV